VSNDSGVIKVVDFQDFQTLRLRHLRNEANMYAILYVFLLKDELARELVCGEQQLLWQKQVMKSKCIPILLYALEVCNLRKRDLQALDFKIFCEQIFNEIISNE